MNRISITNKKTVIEYLFTGVAIVLFSLFFHADFGLIFMVLYLILPLVSVSLVFLTRDKIDVSAGEGDYILQKGEQGTFRIEIINKSILPVPRLKVLLKHNEKVRYEDSKDYQASIGGKGSVILDGKFRAVVFGAGTIGIGEIILEDMFGFLNLSISGGRVGKTARCMVQVLPAVPEVSGVEQLYPACIGESEEENNMLGCVPETKIYQYVPGYEYREYVPGDPIKKINWKLSVKKEDYMIRLDEPVISANPAVWLEKNVDMAYFSIQQKLPVFQEEHLAESCIGCVKALLDQGMEVSVFVPGENGYEEVRLRAPEEIFSLQQFVMHMRFHRNYGACTRPEEWDEFCRRRGSVIVFAVTVFDELQQRMEEIQAVKQSVIIAEEGAGDLQTLKFDKDYVLGPMER